VGQGRLVCSKCYNVIEGGAPVAPTAYGGGYSSTQASSAGNTMTAFSIAVAVLFIIALVFVIRYNQGHNANAIPDSTTTTTDAHPNLPGTPVPRSAPPTGLPGTPVTPQPQPNLPGTPVVQPGQPVTQPPPPQQPTLPGAPVPQNNPATNGS
jgi:cell division protein FtsN